MAVNDKYSLAYLSIDELPTNNSSSTDYIIIYRDGVFYKGALGSIDEINISDNTISDGGTVRYKYLDLSGTGVTWVHTTTAP